MRRRILGQRPLPSTQELFFKGTQRREALKRDDEGDGWWINLRLSQALYA